MGVTSGRLEVRVRRLTILCGCLCCVIYLMLTVPAVQADSTAISQGYPTTSTALTTGDLVGIDPNHQGYVLPATIDNPTSLLGVVANRPLLTLSDGTNQVQVVTGGTVPTLVSDINGTINIGDRITLSPINGIGMKASDSGEIVGVADGSLQGTATVPLTVTDKSGKSHTIHSGLVSVQIGVAYYAAGGGQTNSVIPGFLQNIANTIAGRTVSAVRVLVSLLIILLGFVSAGVILYASIRSGIVSVGRNPLAARAIHRSLVEVVLVAVGILLAMVAGVYIVLTA